MNFNVFAIALSVFFLTACSPTKSRFPELYFPINGRAEVYDLSHPDSIIPAAWTLEWDGDFLISGGLLDNHWIHFYNPGTGCVEKHCVGMGEGPGEILQECGMHRDKSGLKIYDLFRNMIYSYDDSIRYIDREEVRVDSLPIVTNVYFINNDRTVVFGRAAGYDTHESICVTSNGSQGNIYSGNPLDFDEDASVFYSRARFSYDPESSFLATASVNGGVIETFHISGNEIEPKACRLIYPLEISDDPNLPGAAEDCIIGITAITNDRNKVIVALCGERDTYASTDITVWDWDLNPVACYSFEGQIIAMVHGHKEDEIYAIVATDGGSIKLVRTLCPGIDSL